MSENERALPPVVPGTPGRGFRPTLVTRVIPGVYWPEQMSPFASPEAMLEIAKMRSASRKLSVCLVLAPDDCIYVEPDGSTHRSSDPPRGGTVIGRPRGLPGD